jgi:hypothetical protein
MEDKMKYFIPMIILSFILLSCAKKDDDTATTTDTLTCTGTSSGSGPTIGSVALEEASYLSTCFGASKVKMEFKNNSSAQYTSYAYGDSSCSGTPSESSFCLESITVSSTTVTKPVYYVDNSSLGDNVTGYATTGTGKHNSSTLYMSIYAESTSVFWLEQASDQDTLDSNSAYLFKLTKQ